MIQESTVGAESLFVPSIDHHPPYRWSLSSSNLNSRLNFSLSHHHSPALAWSIGLGGNDPHVVLQTGAARTDESRYELLIMDKMQLQILFNAGFGRDICRYETPQ